MSTFNAGSIDATLTLDRSPFAQGLRLAREEGNAFENDPINVALELDGGTALARLREQIAALDGKNIRLDVNTTGSVELEHLRETLDTLNNKGINIDVDTAGAALKIDRLRESISTLDKTVDIDVSTAGALEHLVAFRAEAAAILAGLGGDLGGLGGGLGGGGGGGGNGGGLFGGLGGGGSPSIMLTAIATLAPIAAAAVVPLTATVAGLASALTSAGTGVGVLALGVVPVLTGFKQMEKDLEKANTALSKTVPGTQQYHDALVKVNNIQKQLNEQYGPLVVGLDGLRGAWGAFKDATHEDSMGLIVQGMGIAQAILPKLLPIFSAFTPVVSDMLTHLRYFIAGPEMARFLAFIQKYGPDALAGLIDILKNLGGTFVHLIEAFAPFAKTMIGGLDDVTLKWDKWASHLQETQGFHNFIDYATTQGPVMLQTLKDVADALIAIGKGVSPLAGPNMVGLRVLAETIAKLPPDVITALAIGFEAWAVGMWAYTAATTAAAIATTIFDIAASPIILMFLASAGVVVAVVAALVALGIGIYLLATKTQFFQTIWEAVWGAAKATWDWVVGAFHVGIDALVAAWHWLSSQFTGAWDEIVGAYHAATGAISAGISAFTGAVMAIWKPFWDTFGGLFKATWDFILANFKLAWALVQFEFGLAKVFVETFWNAVVTVFTAAWGLISGVLSSIKGGIVAAWDYISGKTSDAWNAVSSAISGPLHTADVAVSTVIAAIRGFIGAGWDYVSGKTSDAWNAVLGAIRGPLHTARTAVSDAIDAIKGFFSGSGTWLVNAGAAIIQGLIDGITSMINKVTDAIGRVTKIISDHIPGSPVKAGPLRVLNEGYAGGQIAAMLADGVSAKAQLVRNAVGDLADLAGMQIGGAGYINNRLGINPVNPPATTQAAEGLDALLEEMQAMREATEEMTDEFKRQNDNMVTLTRQGIRPNR